MGGGWLEREHRDLTAGHPAGPVEHQVQTSGDDGVS